MVVALFLILIKDNRKPCLPAMPKAGKPVGRVDRLLGKCLFGKFSNFNSRTNHSVPRSSHGNKGLHAVNKMMVGPSESLYRQWL